MRSLNFFYIVSFAIPFSKRGRYPEQAKFALDSQEITRPVCYGNDLLDIGNLMHTSDKNMMEHVPCMQIAEKLQHREKYHSNCKRLVTTSEYSGLVVITFETSCLQGYTCCRGVFLLLQRP